MESVNVLVTLAIGDECLRQIANVSPRIKLTDVSDLLRAERRGDLAAKEKLDVLLAEVEVIYGLGLPQNVTSRAPKLKWIQVVSGGVDMFLDNDIIASPVIMTNTSGIHATAISEFVLGLMLMFVKKAPLLFRLKQEKQWKRLSTTVPGSKMAGIEGPTTALRSKTVGIVGLGSIGREVARLAKAFSMKVIATRRSAKKAGRARYVDILLPRDQLHELLRESDFVVLGLPLTPETNKLIGEEELRAMKPTAYLINVTRGAIVDETALVHALEEHWIAGAGLDVVATEPLPADSKLWELPNVILSPHISGALEDYTLRATDVFLENLRRYLNDKNLLNVVDKKKGY